jgi:hypothetical protein
LPIKDASDEETEEPFESRRRHDDLQRPPDWEVYESDFDYGDEDEEFRDPVYQLRNSENYRGQKSPLWFKAACVNNIENISM